MQRLPAHSLFVLLVTAAPTACGETKDGDSDSGSSAASDATGDDTAGDDIAEDTGEDGAAACGPSDLCTRSIDECALDWTLEQCEAWYDDPTQCTDFPGYVECNCECITQTTCDDYNGCGQICFNDFCM